MGNGATAMVRALFMLQICPALPSRNVDSAASAAQQWTLSATFECS